ncbi:unnamed protein product [Alopecurus aequalis]
MSSYRTRFSSFTTYQMPVSPSEIPPPATARRSDDCRNRIYNPGNTSGGEPMPEDTARERSELLHKIHDSYECAYKRLTMANVETPFVGAGLSFGLLDPTANIIYNTLTAADLCHGAADTDNLSGIKGVNLLDMAQRSLDGNVAFLTCFFRYLVDWEAVRYLLLAGADLVVAVRLVVHDRCLSMFDFNSDTSKAIVRSALMCAALASKHMNPEHLVRTWLSPSCSLQEAVHAIQNQNDVNHLPVQHSAQCSQGSWHANAAPRFRLEPRIGVPSIDSRAVSTLPVGEVYSPRPDRLIHTFYLKALARLPASELRSTYQDSLLKAGHCYGPFDPVSNIIINTIWYNTVSPPSQELELDMISTKSLLRIEARSFYGLVSFLCARGKKLSQAMRILLRSDCTLGESNSLAPFGDQNDIYNALRVADQAAWHPNPVAQAEFLSSCSVSAINPLPPGDAPLDSDDVRRIARMLCPGSPTHGKSLQHESVPRPKLSSIVRYRMANWKDEYTRISKKVRAALASYALQNKEPMYDLHVICGVNNSVSGPDYCEDTDGPDFIYHHSHVNFLASRRGENPKLFFAELTNDIAQDEGGKVLLCCPVNFPRTCQEQIRCLYYDYEGTKIVHPAEEEFQFKGRDLEFQKMACGKDPYEEEIDPDGAQMYTYYSIISVSRQALDRVGALVDDYIYTNYYDDDTDDEGDSDDDYLIE